ncbi:MAG: dipeptidase, partial [Anaerolineae bacterium]
NAIAAEQALQFHHASLVFDGHCDTILRMVDGTCQFVERSDVGQVDLPRLRDGGVDAQIFACCVGGPEAERPLVHFLRMADALHTEVEAHPAELVLARCAADIEQAHRDGKTACILSMEGAEPLEEDLAVLRSAYRLGLRNIGLVWSGRNALGSAVFGDGIDDSGLSEFGREVVRECNRLGIMVDMSHLNEAGFWDVIDITEKPVVASHSNARKLYDHPRNLWDEQIQAIAEAGGLVGVVFTFLTEGRSAATLNHVLDQVDHMVALVGPEYVGLGSDFDGIRHTPAGLEDVSRMGAITRGLLARGYQEEDVVKILGGNWLRVFREVAG